MSLEVTIQPSNKNLLFLIIRCFSAEVQQVREELGFVNGNDMSAAILLASSQLSQKPNSMTGPCQTIVSGDFMLRVPTVFV